MVRVILGGLVLLICYIIWNEVKLRKRRTTAEAYLQQQEIKKDAIKVEKDVIKLTKKNLKEEGKLQ